MKYIFLFTLIFQILTMNAQDKDPWTVYMTPSANHKLLSDYTGDYQLEIEMNGLTDPIVLNSSHQMILGNRFLEMKQKGKMMGMDYESIFTIGYNTIDKTFSMTTITNMGTGTLALNGEWDEKTQKATLFGVLTNPVSNNKINVRQTLNFLSEGSLLIESYDQEGENPEKKTVQYKFYRK